MDIYKGKAWHINVKIKGRYWFLLDTIQLYGRLLMKFENTISKMLLKKQYPGLDDKGRLYNASLPLFTTVRSN